MNITVEEIGSLLKESYGPLPGNSTVAIGGNNLALADGNEPVCF